VRIFLSSPGDVAAERAAARDLLLGLARGRSCGTACTSTW
jgi:hypothetical protein